MARATREKVLGSPPPPDRDQIIGSMTMRQWYAGMAMHGMLAHGDSKKSEVVRVAFEFADAMLEESRKGGAA